MNYLLFQFNKTTRINIILICRLLSVHKEIMVYLTYYFSEMFVEVVVIMLSTNQNV